jgi:catalase (peroxidase I)
VDAFAVLEPTADGFRNYIRQPWPKSMHAATQQAFMHDFVSAWNKVMNLDRFDLA